MISVLASNTALMRTITITAAAPDRVDGIRSHTNTTPHEEPAVTPHREAAALAASDLPYGVLYKGNQFCGL